VRQALARPRGRRGGHRRASEVEAASDARCRPGSPARRGPVRFVVSQRRRPDHRELAGYMREYAERTRTLDPAEYRLNPPGRGGNPAPETTQVAARELTATVEN